MRTLVIIIVLVLIVIIAKRLLQKPPTPARRSQKKNERMVQCASCGIYIPEQEALQRAGHYYCSQKHLDEDLHK